MGIFTHIFQAIEPKDQISLILSSISILISFFVGAWNFFYSKRQFQAIQYPVLKFELKTNECDSGTCLQLLIKNLSKDKSVVNAHISLLLRNPTRLYWLGKPRLANVLSDNDISIEPGNEFILSDHRAERNFNSLEQLLLNRFPAYIQAEKVGKTKFTYYLAHEAPLHFRVVVTYKPGYSGASRISVQEEILVNAVTSRFNQRYRLNYWNE